MSDNLEYKGTVRAVSDRIVADIYHIKGSLCYMVNFSSITLAGKKQALSTKMIVPQDKEDLSTLKDEIRDIMILEAFN